MRMSQHASTHPNEIERIAVLNELVPTPAAHNVMSRNSDVRARKD
jgi:hypothetical protein